MMKILVVEDDKDLNKGVCLSLTKEGYAVFSAFCKKECYELLDRESYDFFILDIKLPDGVGIDICKKIRETSDVPVLFFSACDTETDMLKGFSAGCDDYIAKPFSLEVLKQKIKIMAKLKGNNNIFTYKDLSLHYEKMKVTVNNKEIKLTPTEYRLLELLSKNKGRVLTKEVLLEKIWDNSGNFVDENTVNVNITRLRKKIDCNNVNYITTVFGIGYTFGE